jgi:hemerythrin
MESSGFPDFRHHLELHERFSAEVADVDRFLGRG